MSKIVCRKYFAILEEKTGYLVAVLPYTAKKPKEITSDLKEILTKLCEKHPEYKDTTLRIKTFRKPLVSQKVEFMEFEFPF